MDFFPENLQKTHVTEITAKEDQKTLLDKNRKTHKSKGYGYNLYEDAVCAMKQMNGYHNDNEVLGVEMDKRQYESR